MKQRPVNPILQTTSTTNNRPPTHQPPQPPATPKTPPHTTPRSPARTPTAAPPQDAPASNDQATATQKAAATPATASTLRTRSTAKAYSAPAEGIDPSVRRGGRGEESARARAVPGQVFSACTLEVRRRPAGVVAPRDLPERSPGPAAASSRPDPVDRSWCRAISRAGSPGPRRAGATRRRRAPGRPGDSPARRGPPVPGSGRPGTPPAD